MNDLYIDKDLWFYKLGGKNVLLRRKGIEFSRLVPMEDFGGEEIYQCGCFISEELIRDYIIKHFYEKKSSE